MNIYELFVNIRDTFVISLQMSTKFSLQSTVYVILHAKQKQPGVKKVRGQSEATNISDQKL